MASHSSVLAWRIPGIGEPDGLPSMGSHSVGHDWSDLAAAAVAAPEDCRGIIVGPMGLRKGAWNRREGDRAQPLKKWKVKGKSVTQSCPTLSDPMDCTLPGSSIHGIFQARVLELGAITFSGILSYIQINLTIYSRICGESFKTLRSIKEHPSKWKL